ncbi:hypothetical protein AB0D49_23260 [Streptomyces sp. NPDC048290]|uniref:Rv1733c family protein n=1 Tax=Streptomyces sp. NPDC048290 TaxID=3155811 RepID=UPI00342B1EA4
MRAIRGLWRWRHNPLCRTTDLLESWLALSALLLILVTAPALGVLAGTAAQDALERSVAEQHASRAEVTATVVRELDRSVLDIDPEAAASDTRSRVLADWTAPDGSEHRGPALTRLTAPEPGDRFPLWTDLAGRTVARPLDSATAGTHAVLAGLGAALSVAGLLECGRRLLLWRLVRRRYDHWDRAWQRAGPDWGRTGTGS